MSEVSTVTAALHHHADTRGDKAAFIFRHPDGSGGKHRVVQTFGQIHHLGGRFAAVLRKRGVKGQGDLVANTLPNCPERVICEAGVLMTGAATVNAHCLLADGSDLFNTLRQSRAVAVLVDPDVIHSPWHVLQKHVTIDLDQDGGMVTSSTQLPDLKQILFVRRTPDSKENDFLSKLESSIEWFESDDIKPDDVCSVFTTSGSTGFSKLVVHTHGALLGAVVSNNPVYEGLSEDKKVEFSMAPLGWMGGYAGNYFLTGTTRVLCDAREGLPKDLVGFILTCVKEEKVNLMFVPVPRLDILLEGVRKENAIEQAPSQNTAHGLKRPAGSLQIVGRLTVGGQPITKAHVLTASLLAPSVFILYGSTETFLISSMTIPDPDAFEDHDCGVLVKGSTVKVVSMKDERVEMPVGQAGLILFKREEMMKRYLHDPQATAQAFTEDGLFRTGDIGYLDARGHLIVQGRGSDAIMQGPYIFYPGWLEERIKRCPGVRDAMIVGVLKRDDSEEICACITGDVTIQQVREYVERDIVASEDEPLSPRPRHYLSFDAFPVTGTGKPIRTEVKLQAKCRLSQSDMGD